MSNGPNSPAAAYQSVPQSENDATNHNSGDLNSINPFSRKMQIVYDELERDHNEYYELWYQNMAFNQSKNNNSNDQPAAVELQPLTTNDTNSSTLLPIPSLPGSVLDEKYTTTPPLADQKDDSNLSASTSATITKKTHATQTNTIIALDAEQLVRKRQLEQNQEIQELVTYLTTLEEQHAEFEKDKKKKLAEALLSGPGAINTIKRQQGKVIPTTLTAAELTGTFGFVTNIIILSAKVATDVIKAMGAGFGIFFGIVASPLALGAMAGWITLDTYGIWADPKKQQRKSRYSANVATLGLLAVAISIIMGAIIAPIFTIPLIFIAMTSIGYAKEKYILRNTEAEIKAEQDKLDTKKGELSQAIEDWLGTQTDKEDILDCATKEDIYNAIKKHTPPIKTLPQFIDDEKKNDFALNKHKALCLSNPKIKRLAMQVNASSLHLERLQLAVSHSNQEQMIRRAFLVSSAFLFVGAIIFPPFSIVGAVGILITVIANTVLTNKRKDAQLELNKRHEANNNSSEEESRIMTTSFQQVLENHRENSRLMKTMMVNKYNLNRQLMMDQPRSTAAIMASLPRAAGPAPSMQASYLPPLLAAVPFPSSFPATSTAMPSLAALPPPLGSMHGLYQPPTTPANTADNAAASTNLGNDENRATLIIASA